MRFEYFIPNRAGVSAADLAALGLGHAFGGNVKAEKLQVERGGPGGTGGVLVAPVVDGVTEPPLKLDPSATWRKIPGSKCYLRTDRKPGPEDLSRPPLEITAGYTVRLSDGNVWTLPTARCYPEGTRLQERYVLGDDGQVGKQVLEKYAGLYRHADRVWEVCEGGEDLPVEDCFGICVEALAVNYRVGAAEVDALCLLDDTTVRHIFFALVDRFAWDDFQAAAEAAKKKGPPSAPAAGSSTAPGGEA